MSSPPFFQGDLQSGISTAIQQQKLVTCFVYADDDVSQQWETILGGLSDELQETSILLKIKEHSQEAAFLSAFSSIAKAPTIVVIDNGRVVDKVDGSLSQDELSDRILVALSSRSSSNSNGVGNKAATTQAAPVEARTASRITEVDHASTQSATPSARSEATPTTTTETDLQTLIPGRAERMEADQAAKREAEKARRVARAEEIRKEKEAALSSNAQGKRPMTEQGQDNARTDWIKQQSKRKQEAAVERQRILKQIEADKAERKHRAALEKESAVAAGDGRSSARSTPAPTTAQGRTCALQVRLLDGSSMKTQLASTETLATEVRRWITETAPPEAVDRPYNFRHLLAPLPSRTFESADEDQTLQQLGLVPSATLVLIEDVSAVAKADASRGGILGYVYAFFASILAFIGYFLGTSKRPESVEPSATRSSSSSTNAKSSGIELSSSSSKKRSKTFAESRLEDEGNSSAEFYNGNSSAFESRKDDDES